MAVMYRSTTGLYHIASTPAAFRALCGALISNTSAADHAVVQVANRCGHVSCKRALSRRVEQEERTRELRG